MEETKATASAAVRPCCTAVEEQCQGHPDERQDRDDKELSDDWVWVRDVRFRENQLRHGTERLTMSTEVRPREMNSECGETKLRCSDHPEERVESPSVRDI